jgi:hypothetical protein
MVEKVDVLFFGGSVGLQPHELAIKLMALALGFFSGVAKDFHHQPICFLAKIGTIH